MNEILANVKTIMLYMGKFLRDKFFALKWRLANGEEVFVDLISDPQ